MGWGFWGVQPNKQCIMARRHRPAAMDKLTDLVEDGLDVLLLQLPLAPAPAPVLLGLLLRGVI